MIVAAYGRHTQAGIARRLRERREAEAKRLREEQAEAERIAKMEAEAAAARVQQEEEQGDETVVPLVTFADQVRRLIAEVAQERGSTFQGVIGPSRKKFDVHARHAAMHAVKARWPRLTNNQMGRLFDRDHSTIVHALQKDPEWINGDHPNYRRHKAGTKFVGRAG